MMSKYCESILTSNREKHRNLSFKLIPFVKSITGTIKAKIVTEFHPCMKEYTMSPSSRGIHEMIHEMSLHFMYSIIFTYTGLEIVQ